MIPEKGKSYNVYFKPADGCGSYEGAASFNGGLDEELEGDKILYSFDVKGKPHDFLFAEEDIHSESIRR
jgi:hypothetical protein